MEYGKPVALARRNVVANERRLLTGRRCYLVPACPNRNHCYANAARFLLKMSGRAPKRTADRQACATCSVILFDCTSVAACGSSSAAQAHLFPCERPLSDTFQVAEPDIIRVVSGDSFNLFNAAFYVPHHVTRHCHRILIKGYRADSAWNPLQPGLPDLLKISTNKETPW